MFSGEHTDFFSHACSFSWSSDKLRTGMPKDSALVNLLPALSPASKKAVFLETLLVTFPRGSGSAAWLLPGSYLAVFQR